MRILIAPRSATAHAVFDRLSAWSAAGLIESFAWWWSEAADGEQGVLTVRTVVDGDHRAELLQDALADTPARDTVFVGVLPLATGDVPSPEFSRSVHERLQAAANVLAFAVGQPLQSHLIAIPQEVGQPIDPLVFDPGWATNLYVAPEDRSTPAAPNQLPERPERFVAHAAHAIATLADLWCVYDGGESVLTQLGRLDQAAPDTPVRVVRSFSRTLDFGYVPSQLSARVFRAQEAWPNPDHTRFDRASDTGPLIEHIVKRYLEKHQRALGLTTPVELSLPEPEELTLWNAIRRLFREVLARWRDKPAEILQDALFDAYEKLAARVERVGGHDRGWVIKRPGDAVTVGEIRELRRKLDRPVTVPDGAVLEAWTDLRRFSLALVDGAELPRDLDEDVLVRADKRAVITDPRAIVPDPAKLPPATDEHPEPRACDPRAYDPSLRAEERDVGSDEVDHPEAPAQDLVSTTETPKPAWSPSKDDLQTPVWAIGRSLAAWLREAEQFEVDEDAEAEQEREAEAAQEAVKEASLRADERRRALLQLTILSAGGVAVGVIALALGGWLVCVAALLVSAVVWLCGAGVIGRRIIGRRQAVQLRAARREIKEINAILKRAQRRGDAGRLRRRYREYLDWAEIVGWTAHHPWVGEPLRRVEVRPSLEATPLPAALGVGVAQVQDKLDVLGREAKAALLNRGWLSRVYVALDQHAMAGWQADFGDPATSPPNPAGDITDDREGPRTYFLEAMRSGEGRHLSDNDLTRSLLIHIDMQLIDALADDVTRLMPGRDQPGRHTQPLGPSVAWFGPPQHLPELADAVQPSVVRVIVDRDGRTYGGTGVLVRPDLLATARHVVEGAHTIKLRFEDGTCADGDLAHVAPDTDLALVSVGNGSSQPTLPLATPGALRQGDPVVSLGHPALQDGEPTLAFGIVTAIDRRIRLSGSAAGIGAFDVFQATYRAEGGASGSPVVNLEGELVGILSGVSSSESDDIPDYLSSAVPVANLIVALEDTSRPRGGVKADAGEAGPAGARWEEHLPEKVDLRPAVFLHELDDNFDDIAFHPQHWAEIAHDPHLIDRALTLTARVDQPTVAALAGPARFDEPIRITSYRIEVSAPVTADQLVSCAGEGGTPAEIGRDPDADFDFEGA